MNPSSWRLKTTGPLLGLLTACALAAQAAPPAPAVDDPSPAAPLDLPTLLTLVARQSHAADVAAADLRAAVAGIDGSKAHWWPSVDLSGQYTIQDHAPAVEAGAFRFSTSQKDFGQYALQARELLYDGGRRSLAVEAATRRAEAVRLGGAAAVQQAQTDAVDAYLAVLELEGSRRVLERRRAALAAHLKVAHDLFDQGLVARNDLLETEVRQRRVDDQITALDDRLAVAKRDLNRRLGSDPAASLAVPDSLPPAPDLGADRDALLQAAGAGNARVQAAEARHAAGVSALELARRAWFPSFFVGAQHSYLENRYLVYQNVNAVMAGVTWNIFDGGGRKADVRRAEARTAAADRDRLETRRAVAVALDDAWRRWEQARRELATARTDVEASRENLRIVEDQYRQGLARSSDVLDAETLLAGSRYDVVRRHYDIYRAQTALLMTAGRDLIAFYGGAAGARGED